MNRTFFRRVLCSAAWAWMIGCSDTPRPSAPHRAMPTAHEQAAATLWNCPQFGSPIPWGPSCARSLPLNEIDAAACPPGTLHCLKPCRMDYTTSDQVNQERRTFAYDARGRLIQEQSSTLPSNEPAGARTYRYEGERLVEIASGVASRRFDYDSAERVTRIIEDGPQLETIYERDAKGRIVRTREHSMKTASGAPPEDGVRAYEYDALGRLTKVSSTRGAASRPFHVETRTYAGSSLLPLRLESVTDASTSEDEYEWADDGKLKAVTLTFTSTKPGARPGRSRRTFTYDAQGRVILQEVVDADMRYVWRIAYACNGE